MELSHRGGSLASNSVLGICETKIARPKMRSGSGACVTSEMPCALLTLSHVFSSPSLSWPRPASPRLHTQLPSACSGHAVCRASCASASRLTFAPRLPIDLRGADGGNRAGRRRPPARRVCRVDRAEACQARHGCRGPRHQAEAVMPGQRRPIHDSLYGHKVWREHGREKDRRLQEGHSRTPAGRTGAQSTAPILGPT
jgi:hypothetical protein